MPRSSSLRVVILIIIAAVMLGLPAQAHDAVRQNFTVMTRNVYSGADIRPLINAGSLGELLNVGPNVFNRVKATNFPARARALADEISATRPHVIGLQEVALWRTQFPGDGPLTPARTVAFDFLHILREELTSRGLNYRVVAIFRGFDVEFPGLFASGLRDVRFTDRDVILARVNHHVELSNIRKGRFNASFSIPTFFTGPLHYPRGWESVDVTIDGQTFRFVNTHLEVFSGSVRNAQLRELLNGPAAPSGAMPLIMVGDFNFAPNEPTNNNAYSRVIAAGFEDAWAEIHSGPGPTCCQRANLRNTTSTLSFRIDYVFIRGAIDVRNVFRTGQSPADRTPSGLWPSDHAGVLARLRFQ